MKTVLFVFFILILLPYSSSFGRESLLSLSKEDSIKIENTVHESRRNVWMVRYSDSVVIKAMIQNMRKYSATNTNANYWAIATTSQLEYYRGHKEIAFYLLDSLAEIAKTTGKEELIFPSIRIKADMLRKEGQMAAAIKLLFETLVYTEKGKDKFNFFNNLLDLGNMYQAIGNYKEATKYMLKIVAVNEPVITDSLYYIQSLNNVGYVFLLQDSLTKAEYYFKKAEKISALSSNFFYKKLHSMAMGNLGETLFKKNEFSKALPYLQFDFDISRQVKNWDSYALVSVSLSKCYLKMGKAKEALRVLQNSDSIINPKEVSVSNYLLVVQNHADIYAETGNYKAAFMWQAKHDSISKNKFNDQINTTASALKGEYEFSLRMNDAAASKIKIEELNRNLQLLVVGILVILILLGFTIFAFRNKKKLALDLAYKKEIIENINRELLSTNDKLQKLIKEKSSLMYVVSHDLKAPFSRITGFMELMTIDAKNQDFYIKMINLVLQDGSKLIQNLLDNAEIEEGVRKFTIAEICLNNLLNDLVISYAQYAKLKNIDLLYPNFEGAEIIVLPVVRFKSREHS